MTGHAAEGAGAGQPGIGKRASGSAAGGSAADEGAVSDRAVSDRTVSDRAVHYRAEGNNASGNSASANSTPGPRKYLRLTREHEIEGHAPYNGVPARVQWDGEASVPPPANALARGRYAVPLLVEAPIAPPSGAVAEQMLHAELHAQRVAAGLCWQEEDKPEPFDESVFRFGDVSLPAEAVWTSAQKYQFIELLGRRSAANLASIAATVGKPLLDCELYLGVLRYGAAQAPPLNPRDIPEAEEVGERASEETVAENEDHVLGAVDDGADGLLRLDRLEVRMDHSFSSDGVVALVDAVKQRVRTWVEVSDRMGPYDHPRLEHIEEFVEHAPHRMLGFVRVDEEDRACAPPAPGTGPLPFISDVGEAGVESDSESKEEA